MIFYGMIVALQVFCIVDVIRRRRTTIWIMALVFLPVASAIAYFLVEVLPTLQHNRHVRAARQTVIEKLDPERELRAAQQALDVADTMANRIRLADALSELGRHSEGPAAVSARGGAAPRSQDRGEAWPLVVPQ